MGAGPTSAGEAAVAMRKAGCMTLNQSNPDFLAALAEGVTPKEFADAVTAYREEIPGTGLFTYAVKVARTNHAKTASVVTLPTARAGPGATTAPQSRTQLASQNIWDTVNALTQRNSELDSSGDRLGSGQAPVAQLGRTSGA
jgi:hypothetical protein